jgi:hypothetical protein
MAKIRVYDRADEFRFEILGKFAGGCVDDVAAEWTAALPESFHRKFTVDISGMTGYDAAGRKLLRTMHQHGTQFACATPLSLTFFSEISAPFKNGQITMIRDGGVAPSKPAEAKQSTPFLVKHATH